jgi:DNA-binding transcriptional MerR regulator
MSGGSTPTRGGGGLPAKLYFRIGEVSSLVGVEPHVLRYWEREFRSIRPTKSAKGQRVYSRRDVENLMRVRELLYAEGFTIAGAKKKLQKTGLEPFAVVVPEMPAEMGETADAATQTAGETELAVAPTNLEATRSTARDHTRMRASLTDLRTEIEAFLDELGTAPHPPSP